MGGVFDGSECSEIGGGRAVYGDLLGKAWLVDSRHTKLGRAPKGSHASGKDRQ